MADKHPPSFRERLRRWRVTLAGWSIPLAGFLALVWFLLRVIPKPSRAGYPCQRAAFPLASAFVLWVVGFFGAGALLKRARHRPGFLVAGLCLLLVTGALVAPVVLGFLPPFSPARPWTAEAPLTPVGTPRGVRPGCVVWCHDPAAATWDGSTGRWWHDENCDPVRVRRMLDRTLLRLTDASDVAGAWDALFREHNRRRRGSADGYVAGEKIAVKLNLNQCTGHFEQNNNALPSPQVVRALLGHLVDEVGVAEADITLFDSSRVMTRAIRDLCASCYPAVVLVDRIGGDGCTATVKDEASAVHFSAPGVSASNVVRLPVCVTAATYLVNVGLLRGHTLAGQTICAKNHFGSIWTPDQTDFDGWTPRDLHDEIKVDNMDSVADYNALVDLMGHVDLGDKTVLFLVDGLYGTEHQGTYAVVPYASAPFDGSWTASLLASQDGVAIESVVQDILAGEPMMATHLTGTADTFLHQAADPGWVAAGDPTVHPYDPEDDGVPLGSCGVHEHRDAEGLYSGNHGGVGIELIRPVIAGRSLRVTVSDGAGLRACDASCTPDGGEALSSTDEAVHWFDDLAPGTGHAVAFTAAPAPASAN